MSAMLGVIRSSLVGRSMMVLPQEDAGLRIGPSIKRPRSGRNLKVRRSRAGAFDTRGGTWLRGSTALARRFEAKLHCQPVAKVWRRTETGEAPRWQGATTENTGSI